ncbi:DUF4328 domain-containing protein [Segniliparus rugosus]|uniref:DUF4328 domain-containing protein n=1 Tax=Segniliparus rugosus (strain ATCC BAA-974 / DSM 45345 / CCUG 50838 / CIP 108380 / JCM 13579 / CDC 945) TaxID=679197 RepID=E5XUX6_SEGRC|nr:DUF4328 domain-containing protein [Segniliparus rugosus]EFV11812.1 hypothetical protein HMPREF9336_03298 [Segniliparus rugosus ATCC BAA-974]
MTFPQAGGIPGPHEGGPPGPSRPHLPGLSGQPGHWPSSPQPAPSDRPPTRPNHGPNPRIPVLPPGYRWHASRPPSAIPPRPRPSRPPSPTPRYASPPRWGLVQHFPLASAEPAADQEKPLRTALIEIALSTLTTFLGLFAFAEAFRYGLAFYGRGHLLPAALVAVSGSFLSVVFWLSLVLIIAVAAALAWWLWLERDLAYAANHRADPRRWWEILLLALVPLVNLVALGVLLKELLDEHERRGRRSWQPALRSWWLWWAGGHLAALSYALWTLNSSVQARTEALFLGAALGVVLLLLTIRTRRLISAIDASKHPNSPDRADKPVRWVIATDAARTPELASA